MALIEKRLEAIRQITKETSRAEVMVWLLVDLASGETLGVYSDEDRAWAYSEEIFTVYQIEADVIEKVLDEDSLSHRRYG